MKEATLPLFFGNTDLSLIFSLIALDAAYASKNFAAKILKSNRTYVIILWTKTVSREWKRPPLLPIEILGATAPNAVHENVELSWLLMATIHEII